MTDPVQRRLDTDVELPEPGVDRPREQLVWQFLQQARACHVTGSELYTNLLVHAAEDIESSGPCWAIMREHVAPGRGNAAALRLMAAVHRLVLTGRAPALAEHYPSVGGTAPVTTAWQAFRTTLEAELDEVRELVTLPCQTNEPGRSAALAIGMLDVAATGLPMQLLEIGTAAGLNLRWDRFRYAGGGSTWGDVDSPVDLSGSWVDVPAIGEVRVAVVGRRGVDRSPLDPTTEAGRLAVSASIWADQVRRFERLSGAIEIARAVPAEVTTGDAVDWVEATLAPSEGVCTVLFQSVVDEYLSDEGGNRLYRAVEAAAAAATTSAPLAWLRLEPLTALRRHGLTLTTWPGGHQRLLVTSGALGDDVRRSESS